MRSIRAWLALALLLLGQAASAHDLVMVEAVVAIAGAEVRVGLDLPADAAARLGDDPAGQLAGAAHLRIADATVALTPVETTSPPGRLALAWRGGLDAPPTSTAATLTVTLPGALGPAIVDLDSGAAVAPAGAPLAFDLAESHAGGAFIGYLVTGFTHVVPEGPDHVLFVLGLFLLAPGWRQLLGLVTCFTLAHSVTLALALGGLVPALPSVVEPLIALSIAAIGLEAMLGARMRDWRWPLVAGFGLVHGLGFAGALADAMPSDGRLAALAGFNLGIELAQLAVVGAAAALTAWCRDRRWYRGAIALPAAAAITATGLWWTAERAFA